MKYTRVVPDIREDYLNSLLAYRGIDNIEQFKYPSRDNELDPFLLDNMDIAVNEIHNWLAADGRMALIVDSDCDGYTSSTIMYQYLHDVAPECQIDYFLHEGKQHGLEDMINKITDYDIVLIPDASSNDYSYHTELAERGIPVIVLDHHEADKVSEDAIVVNNQLSTNYKNKELTGAGVAYKFCQAYDKVYNYNFAEKYIDLAAIGIVGDMSTILNGETRYIVKQGLSSIRNHFIEALIEKQAYSIGGGDITPTAISFYIVPLINALIRVGKSTDKEIMFNAFIDGNKMVQSTKRGATAGQMESLGQQAARICANAKSRQTRQKDKALGSLEMTIHKNSLNENKILVVPVEDDSIDTTLTGLVAMQLVAKYKKPVLLGRQTDNNMFKGSLRNPDKTALTDLRQFLCDSGYFDFAEGRFGL